MIPIAIQIYSIREEAEKDFAGTIKQIKAMGYDGVELAGLYGMVPERIAEILKENNLRAISAHVPYEVLRDDLQGTINAYKTIGCEYLIIPATAVENRYGGASYPDFIEGMKKIAAACNENGLKLLYHNHDFEFSKTPSGEYALDVLYQDLSSEELQAELDTCWVEAAGESAVTYLNKYKGRCPVIHLKDYKRKDGVWFMPLGQGIIDIDSVYKTAVSNGAKWIVIEQDNHCTGSPMSNMETSLAYVKKNLQ